MSTFVRRHYQAIAKVIGDELLLGDKPTLEAVVGNLCEVFATDNPKFDAKRFRDACGL